MTHHVFWRCEEGHEGGGPLPEACPYCPGGQPCGASCYEIDVAGRRKPKAAARG